MRLGTRGSRGVTAVLVLATLLGAQLFLGAVTQAPAGAAGILPPSDPPSNINFDVPSQCTSYGDSSTTCLNSLLHDVNFGRNTEGLPPMVLPNGFPQMGTAEQLLVLANLERGARGLSQFAGLSPILDTASVLAAVANTDPSPPAGYTFTQWGSNYADDVNPLEADFLWMYDDGVGGTNVDCQTGNTSGCWGHRNNILGPWLSEGGQSTAMGDGFSGSNIYTEIFANKVGTPDGVVDPYGLVTYPTQVAPQVVTVSTNGVTSPGAGTPVTVDGNYFSYFSAGQVPTVDFGSSPATNVHVNWDGQLTADAPANPFGNQAGSVVVTVTTPAGTSSATPDSETNEFRYSAVSAPTVTAVSPASGSQAGGDPITITGANLTGATGVDFGSIPASTFSATSSTSITVTAPPSTNLGTVDLTVTTAGGTSTTSSSDRFTYMAPPASGPYTPLTPVRICDTRAANPSQLTSDAAQCDGAGNVGDTIAAGGTLTINVAGHFGVPADATAVVLNVTAISPNAAGQLIAFPAGAVRPLASNLNYSAGEVVPNLVEVGTGAGGQVSIYSLARVDVVVDLEGYVAATGDGGAGLYNPLPASVRLCDTRANNPSGLTGGDAQCNGINNAGTRLPTGGTLNVQVTGNANIPAGAIAAVLNVTVVNPAQSGFLTVYPQDAGLPVTANVNYLAGQTTGNRVIVPLSTTGATPGAVSIYSKGSADVVVDVSGYLSGTGGSGAQFSAEMAPVRICDTRANNPSALIGTANQCDNSTIGQTKTLTLSVEGLAGIPSGAKALVINVTAVKPTANTVFTIFPGPDRPDSSDLNPAAGDVKGNLTIATISAQGTISIYNYWGSVNAVVDVLGYYS